MLKKLVLKNATSQRVRLMIRSQTTNLGISGLTSSSLGLSACYYRNGDTAVTPISLVPGVVGTYASGSFGPVDNTNMPGMYELGVPAAVFAGSDVVIYFTTPTGSVCDPLEFQVVAYDLSASPGTPNSLIGYGTTSGLLNPDGTGKIIAASVSTPVTVGTNSDKTGYALTQSFPSNFGSLAIANSGKVGATMAAGDGADDATLVSLITPARAGNLDNLDAKISSVASSSFSASDRTNLAGLVTTIGANGANLSNIPQLAGVARGIVASSPAPTLNSFSATTVSLPAPGDAYDDQEIKWMTGANLGVRAHILSYTISGSMATFVLQSNLKVVPSANDSFKII